MKGYERDKCRQIVAPFECSCAHDKAVSLVAPEIPLLGLSVGDLG